MPNIPLTPSLRSSIRELRKNNKIRGDVLSNSLGKGSAYISQIEGGRIQFVDLEMLNRILQSISNTSDKTYNNFLQNYLSNVILHMSQNNLMEEIWVHQLYLCSLKSPITDPIIEFIASKLQEREMHPETFATLINQNRILTSYSEYEKNDLHLEISTSESGSPLIAYTIRYDIPSDMISRILNKEITEISYINLHGIIFYLFYLVGNLPKDGLALCNRFLYEHGFLNTFEFRAQVYSKRVKTISAAPDLMFYGQQPVDYEEKYHRILEDILIGFDIVRKRDIVFACDILKKLQANMHNDLGFMLSILSAPLKDIPLDKKQDFWYEFSKLVDSYKKEPLD